MTLQHKQLAYPIRPIALRLVPIAAALLCTSAIVSAATPVTAHPRSAQALSEEELQKLALDYLKSGDATPAAAALERELEQQARDLVVDFADIAGAAVGLPGVGSFIGSYVDLFGDLANGTLGGPSALEQRLARLEARTATLERAVPELRMDLNALTGEIARNENNDRIASIWGLNGRTAYMGQLADAIDTSRHRLASMSAEEKKFFLWSVIDDSTALLPRPAAAPETDVWKWRPIEIRRGGASGPSARLLAPRPSDALALEPYLQTLALIASIRAATGAPVDAEHQKILDRHAAFLIGGPEDAANHAIAYSFSEQFESIECSWGLKYLFREGVDNVIEAKCTRGGAARTREFPASMPTAAQIGDRTGRLRDGFINQWLSGQYADLAAGAYPELRHALLQSDTRWQALTGAARAIGGRLPVSYAAPAPSNTPAPPFDASMTPIDSRRLFAVDGVGKMHVFIHQIGRERPAQREGGPGIDRDAFIESVVTDRPGLAIPSIRDRDTVVTPPVATPGSRGDLAIEGQIAVDTSRFDHGLPWQAPAQQRPTPRPVEDIATIERFDNPAVSGLIERLADRDLRSQIVEQEPAPGSWSGITEVLPAYTGRNGVVVFAERSDGTLALRTLGPRLVEWGSPAWQGDPGARHLFSAGEGILYGVNGAGDLVWYRYRNLDQAYVALPQWEQHVVGTGWGDFTQLAWSSDGVIYGSKRDGTLWWIRHNRWREGGSYRELGAWTQARAQGGDWSGYIRIFAAPGGFVYGVNARGELFFHRHRGWQDGTPDWDPPVKLADGWGEYRIAVAPLGDAAGPN